MRRFRLLIVFVACGAIGASVLFSISCAFDELTFLGCSDDLLEEIFYALLLPGRLLTWELRSILPLETYTRDGITDCFLAGDVLVFAVLLFAAAEVLRKFGKLRGVLAAGRPVLVGLGTWLLSGLFIDLLHTFEVGLSYFQPGRLIAFAILYLAPRLDRSAQALDRLTLGLEWLFCWLLFSVAAWKLSGRWLLRRATTE